MSVSCTKNFTMSVAGISNASAWWKFEELGSGDRSDSILNLDTVKLAGRPNGNDTGVIGNGVILPAVAGAGNCELIGDIFNQGTGVPWSALTYPANKGASISLWIKYTNVQFGGTFEVDFTVQNAGGNIHGGFGVKGTVIPGPNISVDIFKPPFGAVSGNIAIGNPPLDAFQHVVVTYDQVADKATAYLNGVQVGSLVTGTPWTSGTNSSLVIAWNSYWITVLDELGWWNDHVLNQAEVTSLFNGGNGARASNVP